MAEYIYRILLGDMTSHGMVHYEDIMSMPTADVVERKYGKWMVNEEYVSTSPTRGRETHVITWLCSNCLRSNGRRRTNFCPNCGAKMESEGEK